MKVTIVVCTWNRVHLLRETLEAYKSLHVPDGVDWDLHVINNASTDGTDEFLRGYKPTYPFSWQFEGSPGKSNALNAALSTCKADYLLFTDDDAYVDVAWLASFVAAAKRYPGAVGFGGMIEPLFPVPPNPILMKAFPALKRGFCGLDRGPDERVLPEEHVTGANMGFRHDAIASLRFRTDLGVHQNSAVGGEELEFQDQIRARGGDIVWVPSMKVRHYVSASRMTLRNLLKMAKDDGRREVRLYGVPEGPSFAGVPRWLVRKMIDFHLGAWLSLFRLDLPGALASLRRSNEFYGMAKESWCKARSYARRR